MNITDKLTAMPFYNETRTIVKFDAATFDCLVECVKALERNSHPHVEQFCKERAQQALARLAEVLSK